MRSRSLHSASQRQRRDAPVEMTDFGEHGGKRSRVRAIPTLCDEPQRMCHPRSVPEVVYWRSMSIVKNIAAIAKGMSVTLGKRSSRPR